MIENQIHPTAIIEEGVELWSYNYIWPFCHIHSGTIIGDHNRFEGYCSIGSPPEYHGYMNNEQPSYWVSIWDENIVRENVVITAGTHNPTRIGNNNVLLTGVYIAHDVTFADRIVCSAWVKIAWFVWVMEGVNFGMGALCHQYNTIWAYAMIGMGTIITKNSRIEPWKIYIGSPARYLKDNAIWIQRSWINAGAMEKFQEVFQREIAKTN